MGRNKKKNAGDPPKKADLPPQTATENSALTALPAAPVTNAPVASPITAADPAPSKLRRLVPDLIKVVLAAVAIVLAVTIWYQPPLLQVDHPYVSYLFEGKSFKDAKIYRPVAMPTRFYVELPRSLADRYRWFAIDRRREIAALAEEPQRHLAGKKAIRRSDPLGLDLEFRKLDHSEWQVHFFDDSIVFSNAVLCVRLDTNDHNQNEKNKLRQ